MTSNDALMADLNRWAREQARIDPPAFQCRYYKNCNASIGGTLPGGAGCMMSYVGSKYGSDAVGEEFRLVIVGIDHGDSIGGNFDKRRTGIEGNYQDGGKNFNQHYKGVVKTAAAVFGESGNYCRQNCTKACQKPCEPELTQCVIDRIAQPNLVKCTPPNLDNRTSKATWQMKVNCAHHLTDELKLLRPKLVVFHGVEARQVMIHELKECSLDAREDGSISDKRGSVLYYSKTLAARILFLYHPSRGWLNRQWETVVVPALKDLRLRNLIPA